MSATPTPEQDTTQPKVYAMWHGGSSYAHPYVSDHVEGFDTLDEVKYAFQERMHASRIPATFKYLDRPEETTYCPVVEESTMTVWYYDPRESTDPYPDLILTQGPEDEILEETT